MLFNKLVMSTFRGVARLRAVLRCAAPTTLGWAQTADGLTLALDPEAFIDRYVLTAGYYEREVLDGILANLPKGGVLWDVGANFGLHALSTKYLRPDVTVVCFEPAPPSMARLIVNVLATKLDVKMYSIALGEMAGYENISLMIRGNSGLSSLRPWPSADYDAEVGCRVDTIDNLVASGRLPAPSVIKLDVEGFELSVLKGARKVMRSPDLKAVVFESDGDDKVAIEKLLDEMGFVTSALDKASPRESDNASPNYMALRTQT